MATKNIVPNADSEGQLGTSSKFWSSAYLDGLNIGNDAAANLVFTPSASDTITLAAAANGAFTITTVDAAAAAANIGFVVDGNFTVSNVTSTITSSSSDITTFATTNATSGYTEFAYNTSTVAGYIGNGTSLLSGAANTDFIMRSESGALKFTTGGGNLALTIDSSQNSTFAGNISATDTGATVTIEDNADSTSGGTLALKNSDTGADNHESGRIYFYGDNDGNTVKEAVLMRGIMTDASAGTEDTKLEIMTLANSGQVSSLNIAGNGIAIPDAGTIGSASDADALKIEADGVVISTQGIEFEGTALASGQSGISSSGNGGEIRIYTNGNQAFTFGADGSGGDLTIADGNLVVASGHGIDFSAAKAYDAGDSSTLLDDYEEGLYTPSFTPQTNGSITLSGALNEFSYTKVGRLVTIVGKAEVTSVSSPQGIVRISIPIAVGSLSGKAADFAGSIIVAEGANNATTTFAMFGSEGNSYVEIYEGDTTSLASNVGQEFQANTLVWISMTYVGA